MESTDIDATDRVFRALADGTRRRIWMILGQHPGASTATLTAAFPMLSRWAVMKHLAVMREAELLQTLPDGRSRHHYRVEQRLESVRAWLAAAD